jgi:hypothetical protein
MRKTIKKLKQTNSEDGCIFHLVVTDIFFIIVDQSIIRLNRGLNFGEEKLRGEYELTNELRSIAQKNKV